MNIIQHYKDCDLRLLGWVVENWPVKHGIASVNEFKNAARQLRADTPEGNWTCDCAQRRIKHLTAQINTARKAGNDAEYRELVANRKALRELLTQADVALPRGGG